MKKIAIWIIALLFLLAGCGNETEQPAQQNETLSDAEHEQAHDQEPELHPVEVQILLSPEHPEVDEEVTVTAVVTQGDEQVNDADEVVFEYWLHESEISQSVEGELDKDGQYVATISLAESGVYFVTAHVTARDMHTMPTEPFMVGNVDQAEFDQIVENGIPARHMQMNHGDDHGQHGDDHDMDEHDMDDHSTDDHAGH